MPDALIKQVIIASHEIQHAGRTDVRFVKYGRLENEDLALFIYDIKSLKATIVYNIDR